MAISRPATAPAAALSTWIEAGVEGVRRSNALGLAWLRVGLRTLTLAMYLRYVFGQPDSQSARQLPAVFVNVAHLAVGAAVLALLLRRRHVAAAILAGALSDFAAVSIGAWRAAAGPGAQDALAFFTGVYELVLLFAALTLRTRAVAALSAFSLAFVGFLLARLPVWDSESWLIVLVLAAFAAAATFAGTRMLGLASRTAAEEYGAALLHRHAEELAASNAALREARGRAELLTRLMVHDLRSPLTTVLSGLDVGLQAYAAVPARDPDVEEALEAARTEAWRVEHMVSDLLAVGKLEQGVRAQPAPTDVGALLRDVAQAHERQARREDVSVHVSVPAGLQVSLDPTLVRRSLENLLSNALRHVGRGGRIELAAERGGAALRLAVRNSGPPVPSALRDRLFEKDVSGASGDWARAGLGLHFCRLAAEAHGGRIALVERAGWNVAFEIELPDPARDAAG